VLDVAIDRTAEEKALIHLHRLKTGALLRAACRMGVLAGHGDDAALRAADAYGDAIGLAFQVTDDVLDVTSTPEAMGKPTQADAEARRYTFPAVLGLEASKARAQSLLAQALDALGTLEPLPGPLAALARYAVERTS
jgi:geranylgeranyl diphosphate synthase type II